MSKQERGLTTEQAELIQYLSTGKSYEEAARLLNISSRTVKRWLELPHVAEAYQTVRQDIATHVREQIKALSSKAIQALEDSLSCKAPMVKLTAAKLVLDRVAPENMHLTQPLQGQDSGHVDAALLPYATAEELATIDKIVQLCEQRKQQADQDREMLERKRA